MFSTWPMLRLAGSTSGFSSAISCQSTPHFSPIVDRKSPDSTVYVSPQTPGSAAGGIRRRRWLGLVRVVGRQRVDVVGVEDDDVGCVYPGRGRRYAVRVSEVSRLKRAAAAVVIAAARRQGEHSGNED